MKKFIILIPVVLLALWASVTWIIGSQTKSGFAQALEEVNNNLGAASAFTAFSEESYSRGFLSSEAITKITSSNDSDPDKKDIYLKFKAWHGPLMMTPDGFKIGAEYVLVTLDRDRLPDELRKIVDDGFKQAEPLKLGVFTGFGGGTAVSLEIAPFSSTDADSNNIQFEGFSAELQTNIDTTFAKGKINIGELRVEDKTKGKFLSVAAAEGALDYSNIVVKLTGDGSSHLDFPEIKVANEGITYILKDLHFGSISTEKNGKLDVSSEMSIGGFKGPDKGPYSDVFAKMDGKLELVFSSEGMEAETLRLMEEAQQKMQKIQGGEDVDSETSEEALHDYIIAVSQLLKPGYKLKNHITFTNKSGKSEIGLGLEYIGEKPLFELGTIRDLIEALEVALNLQIAKDLIPPANIQQIQPAISMGFVMDKDGFYKCGAILAAGELTVNGKASPALKQMGPVLDKPIPWEKLGMSKAK